MLIDTHTRNDAVFKQLNRRNICVVINECINVGFFLNR